MRPSKHDYYLEIALQVSRRGTCLRRNYGAVIVNHDQIISTGYTGAPRGAENCIDRGWCERERQSVPQGERYELCRSVHAEMNAVIHASRAEMVGGALYLAGFDVKTGLKLLQPEPCKLCKRVIINAGIREVVVNDGPGLNMILTVQDWLNGEGV